MSSYGIHTVIRGTVGLSLSAYNLQKQPAKSLHNSKTEICQSLLRPRTYWARKWEKKAGMYILQFMSMYCASVLTIHDVCSSFLECFLCCPLELAGIEVCILKLAQHASSGPLFARAQVCKLIVCLPLKGAAS